MRHGVVEGEPGIFPAPVAKVMRSIGGLFGRKKKAADAPPPAPPGETEPPSWSDLDPKAPTADPDTPPERPPDPS